MFKKFAIFLASTVGVICIGFFFNVFFDAPPTRAEHNELKSTVIYIKEDLKELKQGQRGLNKRLDRLIEYIIVEEE